MSVSLRGVEKIARQAVEMKKKERSPKEIEAKSKDILKIDEKGFREILAFSPISVQIFDHAGNTIAVNRAWEELWGATKEEMGAYNILEDDQLKSSGAYPLIERVFRGESTNLPETCYDPKKSGKNGRSRWIKGYAYPLSQDGEITRVVLMHYDITEIKQTEEAHAYLGAIVAGSDDAIISKTLDGVIRSWNESAQRLFGYSAEEAIGQSIMMLVPPDRKDEEERILEQLRRGERADHFETKRLHKNGMLLDLSLTISPVVDDQGRVIGASKVARDITERKRREANLVFLVEVSAELTRLTDIDETMSRLCERISAYLGLSLCVFVEIDEVAEVGVVNHEWHREDVPSVLGTHHLADFVSPEIRRTALAGKVVVVSDVRADPSTNTERYADMKVQSFMSVPLVREGKWRFMLSFNKSEPYRWRDDEKDLVLELANRIGTRLERARAEGFLIKSEEKFRLLFNLIDEGFCIIEILYDEHEKPIDYRFLEANKSFEKQTGLKDAVGKRMRELVPKHEQYWYDIYGRVARDQKAERFENFSGAIGRWYEVYAFPYGDPKGNQVGVLFRDISKRKQEEEHQAEIESQKDDFISIASHELKTPLTSLQAYADLLKIQTRRESDADTRDVVEKIDRQIQKLGRIVSDMFDVTKMENGKMLFYEERICLDELGMEIVNEIRDSNKTHKIETNFFGEHIIFGDRERLGQVMNNFLTNAIKYSPKKGVINVKVHKEKANAVFSIQDFGLGMSKIDCTRVFERFYRVGGSSRSAYPGVGLGLYIAAEIIKRHGGEIGVRSEEGKGSTFYFTLPLASAEGGENLESATWHGSGIEIKTT